MRMMIIKAVITPTSKKAFCHLLTYNKCGRGDQVSPDSCISCDRPQAGKGSMAPLWLGCCGWDFPWDLLSWGTQTRSHLPQRGRITLWQILLMVESEVSLPVIGVNTDTDPSINHTLTALMAHRSCSYPGKQKTTLRKDNSVQNPTGFPLSDHLLAPLSPLNVCLYQKSVVLKWNEVLYEHQHGNQRN